MEFSSGPGRSPIGGQPPGLPVRRQGMKRSAALLLVLALVAACEPSTSTDPGRRGPDAGTPPSSEEPRPPALVTELPDACESWAGSPERPQITFTASGRLYALDVAGGAALCLDERSSHRIEWGGRGDRVLLTAGRDPLAYGESFVVEPAAGNREITWSKPTGTSLVFVSYDQERLLKEEVATGKVTDISFLDFHFDVAYHPAGTHIAVAGMDDRGRIGLFLATNEGTDVFQIVRGETADHIDALAFSHDGRRLYFRGQHGDRFDLHSVRILTGAETADTERALLDAHLETLYSGVQAPSFAVSPFERKPHLLYGGCVAFRSDARIVIGRDETLLDPDLGGIEPVGWLPDGTALFIAHEERCDEFGEGDLYSWKDGAMTLLVEDVDGAAVRARLPDPPDPPARAQGVVA